MKHVLCPKRLWRLLPLLCLAFLLAAGPAFSQRAEAAGSKTSSSAGKWVVKKGKTRYRYANKTYAKKGFRKINGHWYYFDQNGYVKTGWFSVGKSRYYGNKSSAKGKNRAALYRMAYHQRQNLLFLHKVRKRKTGKDAHRLADH